MVIAAGLVLGLTACSVATPPIDTNIASEVSGLYRGTLVTENGEVFLAEEIEMHRISDDLVNIESTEDPSPAEGRFSGFEMRLMRSGAVIHHLIGTEANGTFVLDAAITPDELRIDLPNGMSFDGVRVRSYFE